MSEPIQAIETTYNGVRFRSRTEARWAIFLDVLKIRWEYEPDGFETTAGRYAPDFFLPEAQLWWEVKGVPDQGHEKAEAIVAASGYPLVLAVGSPAFPFDAEKKTPRTQLDLWFPYEGDPVRRYLAMVVDCLGCGSVGVVPVNKDDDQYRPQLADRFIGCRCAPGVARYDIHTDRLSRAYTAAMGARFWEPNR